MLFWLATPGALDLCSSSAADPGADRCFSTVIPTINETVTLLEDFFFCPCRRQHGRHGWLCPRRKGRCGLLAEAQATARVEVPTSPREFVVSVFFEQFHVGSAYP